MARLIFVLVFAGIIAVSVAQNVEKNEVNDKNKDKSESDNASTRESATDYSLKSKYTGLIRPCAKNDISCLRKYFTKHAACKPAKGKVPDPFYQNEMTIFLAFFNITITLKDTEYNGLSSTSVQDFYINRDTDRAVLLLSFQDVRLNSTNAYIRYHRSRKEPAVTRTSIKAFFKSFSTTSVFRRINDLEFETSETHASVDKYEVEFGPEADKYPDPEVQKMFATLLIEPRVRIQEYFLTAAAFYAGNFIQYSICDFGFYVL